MPVPFAFFHLQNFILIIYLLLLAYTYTMLSRYWSILAMFLTCLSLLGLRELACALSDPFGNDDTVSCSTSAFEFFFIWLLLTQRLGLGVVSTSKLQGYPAARFELSGRVFHRCKRLSKWSKCGRV
jgi:hypothetical protein